ncbi:MAG: hypothetical protein NZ828_12225 [Alphaproteobacteria bacterium]|nr:hypothetical protein [Alphaproteobacteria bacterium]
MNKTTHNTHSQKLFDIRLLKSNEELIDVSNTHSNTHTGSLAAQLHHAMRTSHGIYS